MMDQRTGRPRVWRMSVDQWIHSPPASTFDRHEFETYSFSAAGAVVRAQAPNHAGLFWDQLFVYTEEVDLSIRILRTGFRIVYYPDLRVYHCPSQHGRKGEGEYFRLQIRNWIWIFYRHYPLIVRIGKIAVYIAVYIVKSLYAGNLME
jgi:GT2 family glycosyltransferase